MAAEYIRSVDGICCGLCSLTLLVVAAASYGAGGRAAVRVDAAMRQGPVRPIWSYFGFDEPNYACMKHGRKLLAELAALSPAPVYIRSHNLLCTGDGTPALKWGSTNAYTEDAAGRPVYDWTILERIFDAYREAKVKPLVEIGFMPKALSVKPEPYQHTWPKGKLWTGWAYPPKDYAKWAELVCQWVRHSVERYGREEVETWLWEVWNEPDIGYWQGTPEEFHKLYDFAADAVKRALPSARIGGPHTTGPGNERADGFLRKFLEHCARGTNHATGKAGSPLDFVAFHAKGSPKLVNGHVQMGISNQVRSIRRGFEIVASFPEFRDTPVILGESDPEGAAALSARVAPQNGYRNGPLYGAYVAETIARTCELARRHRVNLQGSVTWAFEFEGQPFFEGFRTLATNGIDKPVLSVFRMLGLMSGEWLAAESMGGLPVSELLEGGVRRAPDINAMAAGRDGEVSALIWNYHDDDVAAPDAAVELAVEHLPDSVRSVLVRHYRMDERHSNAFTAWKQMGSPQNLTGEQYARLEAAGRLELLAEPERMPVESGSVKLKFGLPRQGVSLIQLDWR